MNDAERAQRAIALVDLTDLSDGCTEADIDLLCARATGPWGRVAAVCVWPDFVSRSRQRLAGAGVRVATVVNFPTGDERPHAVGVITARALLDGADEIDVVLPYRWWLAGDEARAGAVLDTVGGLVAAAGGRQAWKVILESGELPDQGAIATAARLAIDRGADFVKTSTGKSKVSATPAAAATILEVIHEAARPVGFKPSGGIRTAADADVYLDLADRIMGPDWATPATFRFGASGLLDALVAVVEGSSADSTDAAAAPGTSY